jgi:hypothetical protein
MSRLPPSAFLSKDMVISLAKSLGPAEIPLRGITGIKRNYMLLFI